MANECILLYFTQSAPRTPARVGSTFSAKKVIQSSLTMVPQAALSTAKTESGLGM